MRQSIRIFALAFVFAFFVSLTAAQVATGIPPLNSLEGGPDAVNLGNLNVHMAYPVLHKAGRGVPLNFDLTNDSSFWFPAVSGSTKFWNPVTTGGWSGSPMGVGNLFYSFVTDGTFIQYFNFTYYDSGGTAHIFGGSASWFDCNFWNPCGDFPLINSTTTDSSGFTLNADACFVSGGVCNLLVSESSADGNSIIPQNGVPLNPTALAGSVIDRNGNEITTDKSGNITDTLGQVALKQGGGNPNPFTLTYTSPAGTAAVSVTFKSYAVKTNFGCAGISEYGPLTGSLVDKITLPDGTFYQFTYEATPGFAGDVTGRVASMKLPVGGTISYNYNGTNHGIECKDGSTSGMTRTTPDGTWTYTRTLGTGAASTTTVVDPKGNTTVVQFQGNLETQRTTYQGAIAPANLLQTINTCYNGAASPCTATAITPPVLSRTVTTQLGTAASSVTSKKVYTYNIYGLTTEEDDYDWGPTAPGALLKKWIITYNTSLGNTRNLPATVVVQDGSGATSASATMTYDEAGTLTTTTGTPQHVTFTGPRGNLTTLAVSANATTTLFRKFTYFDTGNPRTATAMSTSNTVPGATTTYNYATGTASCGNSFTTSVSEPLSLSRSMTWDCVGGVMLSSTDENGAVRSTTYTDPFFWRPSKSTDPFPASTSLTYTGANIVESALNFNGTVSTVDLRVASDGLGRQHLTQKKQSPTATNYDTTETDYDAAGLTKRVTLPYVAAAGVTNSTAPAATTTYDALNRTLLSSDSGGGSVAYSYAKNDVLVTAGPAPTGENTKRRQMEFDGLGRLTSVCELTSATGSGTCGQSTPQTGLWTRYSYDANGNLAAVTQNAQATSGTQTRTYVYDRLSRLTSELNPETGTTTYVYDADATCGGSTSQAGQLVKRTDALANVTCYNYDALHRNTSITYPSGPYAAATPAKTYVYDSTTFACAAGQANANVKGRLAEAFTGPSTAKITDVAYCYSPRGEIADVFESTPHSGGYYHIPMTYWENGLLKTFGSFLGQAALGYNPDGEGRPYNLPGNPGIELNSTLYNAAGQPTTLMTSCAGATCYPVTYQYDPNTLRMTQYSAALNNGTLTGTLTWNPNGSLQKLVVADPVNAGDAQSCSYSADDLGRIATANCGAAWSQTFSYDPFSNITKSGSISWMPGYNTSTNRYTLPGTSYDADGNLLNDTSNTFTWDAEGKVLTTHYPNGQTWGLTYDAFGHAVELAINGTYDYSYLNIGKIRLSATGQTANYSEFPLPGGNKYSQGGGATGLQLADWLGTIRAFYSYTGGTLGATGSHAPFGEAYAYQGGYPQGFAGQGGYGWGQGGDGGMANTTYWFPERQYRANQGRFLSPDPAGMGAVDPLDPQSWNRYAYVRNSPLDRADPLGLDDWGDGWGGWDWGGWGGSGGGWGGSINISWGGGGVNVGFSGFGGNCSGESLGLPCGTSITDPKAQLARQMIIAAIKGDWKTVLGLGLGSVEQDLWNKWAAETCNGMCNQAVEDFAKKLEDFNQNVKDCYNQGHESGFGKAVEFFSVWGWTPLDNNYEENRRRSEEVGAIKGGIVKSIAKWGKGLFKLGAEGVEYAGEAVFAGASGLDSLLFTGCVGRAGNIATTPTIGEKY